MALWSPPSPPTLRPATGLPQPTHDAWNSYLSPLDEAARALPRKPELEALGSTALWTAPVKKPEDPLHDGLWGTAKKAQPATVLPGMWTMPQIAEKVYHGLAQPEAPIWDGYLSVADESLRVKPRDAAAPATVESSSLWTQPREEARIESTEPLWSLPRAQTIIGTAGLCPLPQPGPEAVNPGLWSPPARVDAADASSSSDSQQTAGLFSLGQARADFRTTPLPPAAIDMLRKPRAAQEPFPKFDLTRLWNQTWLWDSSAAAKTRLVAKEAEEAEARIDGLFTLSHRRTNLRTTAAAPAALETQTKPRIWQGPLPVLSSDSLWSVRAPADNDALNKTVDWLAVSTSTRARTLSDSSLISETDSLASAATSTSTVASSVSLDDCCASDSGRLRRPVVAHPGDWIAALNEAVAVSFPMRRPTRIDATPAQWLQALNEAMHGRNAASLQIAPPDYQLWSKPEDMAQVASSPAASQSMWQSPAAAKPATTGVTTCPGELDHEHHASVASAGTSRRGRKSTVRAPPPVAYGSSRSIFESSPSETPRDFSNQALWSDAAVSAVASCSAQDDEPWLEESLNQGTSYGL